MPVRARDNAHLVPVHLPRHDAVIAARAHQRGDEVDRPDDLRGIGLRLQYGSHMVMWGRIPDALSGAMANQMYVANFDTEEEMMAFYKDMAATYEG